MLHTSLDHVLRDLPDATAAPFRVTHLRPGMLPVLYETMQPDRAWDAYRRACALGGSVTLSRRGCVIRRHEGATA
jgi:hypothetical protein